MAEFERAIFRVYDRCMEGLRDEDDEQINSKSCRLIETMTLMLSIFILFSLAYLHFAFVGQPGCLPSLLALQNQTHMKVDTILHVNLGTNFYTDGSGTRDLTRQDQSLLISQPILQWQKYHLKFPSATSRTMMSSIRNNFKYGQSLFIKYSHAKNDSLAESNNTKIDDDEIDYDYAFSFHIGELLLPSSIRKSHEFKIINVTFAGEECFGNSFMRFLVPLGGLDTIVINSLMFTFKQSGVVFTADGDFYKWTKDDTVGYQSVTDWILIKFSTILLSFFAFFLLSTATALLVRILISSGVVLLFPLFSLFQLCGIRIVSRQIIRLSYPWIGIPLEMLRARNQSTTPFLIAHITRVVIYYIFYESCQFVFSLWLYGQQQPSQRELWLFATMMLWEYFAMIYVRSRASIHLFPRATLSLFLIYHFYLYSQPFGYHILALLAMFLSSVVVMVFCVRKYELPAYYRGIVNIDRPRMVYNSVIWPTWNQALAPDFTIFMPVTDESPADIYANPVPDRPVGDVELGNIPANAESANANVAERDDGNIGSANSSLNRNLDLSSRHAEEDNSLSTNPLIGTGPSHYQPYHRTSTASHQIDPDRNTDNIMESKTSNLTSRPGSGWPIGSLSASLSREALTVTSVTEYTKVSQSVP